MSIALLALAGVLLGGAWSLRQQGKSGVTIGIVAALGVLSLIAGVLWLLPAD
ncbi:MAG: hypothetical protein H0T78_03710 [Longispora sp.]|nr:hypothetical protein [Longispora sp. (in: high G+C Gram-positive bacteria)]